MELRNGIKRWLEDRDLAPGSRLAVGVSGGVDSMVLLDILRQLHYRVIATHVNFKLRGNESDREAELVKAYCHLHEIPFHLLEEDAGKFSGTYQLNTQLTARKIRYEWWDKLHREDYFDYLLTAHHGDDQLETFLFRLIRGTGLKGLRGIPEQRDFILRPMLAFHRADINAYALQQDVPFSEDSSNLSDAYTRNRIRHHLIPEFEALMPGVQSRIKQTMQRLSLEWKSYDAAYQTWMTSNVRSETDYTMLYIGHDEEAYALRWLEDFGVPWQAGYDFLSGVDHGRFLSHDTYQISHVKEGLLIRNEIPAIHVQIDQTGQYAIGKFALSIEKCLSAEFISDKNNRIQFISPDVVTFPLIVRSPRPGDRFQPFGMQGKSKKLQDLFVDLKLETPKKQDVLLLCNAEHILWVIGIRLDQRASVRGDEPFLYKVQLNL